LDYIIKYLSNPLKTGVYNRTFTVEFSGLEQLFRDIAGYAEKMKIPQTEFIKTAEELKRRVLTQVLIEEKLDEAIRELIVFEECPREILKFFGLHKLPEGLRVKDIPESLHSAR